MLRMRRCHSTLVAPGATLNEERILKSGPKVAERSGSAPQLCEEATAEFAGDPVGDRKVVGPLVAARVADDDVLVIGERPDVGFLGRQHLLAKLGRHTDFLWLGIPRAAVAGSTVDIADDLLDIDGLRSGSNPAVDEDAIGVDGYFDTDQRIRLLPHGGGDDGFRNRIGQPIGVSRGNVFGMLVHGLGSWMIS